MRIISELELRLTLYDKLSKYLDCHTFGWVTGPGRSGAMASVYASHYLDIPYVPCGLFANKLNDNILIIDTARASGRTLRKCESKYKKYNPIVIALYEEPPRVKFWYERDSRKHLCSENIIDISKYINNELTINDIYQSLLIENIKEEEKFNRKLNHDFIKVWDENRDELYEK